MFFVIESKVVKVYKIINFERDLFDRNVCLLRLEFGLFVVKDVLNVVILSCVLEIVIRIVLLKLLDIFVWLVFMDMILFILFVYFYCCNFC